jgi:peptidoglycan hydrolase-like protein with peptidoglycan-binding domain/predicted RNA-binding Zn-ribbon protein involved in translation (DUF1610 family)
MADEGRKDKIGFAGIGRRLSELQKDQDQHSRKPRNKGDFKSDVKSGEGAQPERGKKIPEAGGSESRSGVTARDGVRSDWMGRKLCSDGTCVGVIGPDGRCTECGKPDQPSAEGRRFNVVPCPSCAIGVRLPAGTERVRLTCPNCGHVFVWDEIEGRVSEVGVPVKAPVGEKKGKKRAALFVVFALILGIIIYAYSNKERRESRVVRPRSPSTKNQTELLSPPRQETVRKQGSGISREAVLRFSNNRGLVKRIQSSLSTLGYPVGKVDGALGPKTISAFMQFAQDFAIGKTPEGVLSHLWACSLIADSHPDFREIILSGELEAWVRKQPNEINRIYIAFKKSGSAQGMIGVIDRFDFFKENPRPAVLPFTGRIEGYYSSGVAPLEIRTKNMGDHYYVKLVETPGRETAFRGFVRAGETLETKVPLGSYYLRYATGEAWYGEKYLFGPDTVCSEADKVLRFYKQGVYVYGHTVELFLQRQGNLGSRRISSFDF